MVGLATSPPGVLLDVASRRRFAGRYCRGQEHREFAPHTGSFAAGQARQARAVAEPGRFSTGQETRSATRRMGSFADTTFATAHP